MADYCDPSNFIGTYAPSSSSGGDGTITTKNIDCVTLEADTVTCSALTINGESIEVDLTNVIARTVNQSATDNPQVTVFAGTLASDEVSAPQVNTDTIVAGSGTITVGSPMVCSSTLTSNSSITVSNSSGTSTLQALTLYEPNQASGGVQLLFGKNTSSNNCGVLGFNYTATGSTSNNLSLTLANQPGLQIYPSYVNVASSLNVAGVPCVPRQIGTMATLAPSPTSYSFNFTTIGPIRRMVFSIADMIVTDGTNNPPLLQLMSGTYTYASNVGAYVGLNAGNNASATRAYADTGIPLWNNLTLPPSSGSYKISGSIEFTYAGDYSGTQQCWTVKGIWGTSVISPAGPYWVYSSGVVYLNNPTYPTLNGLKLVAAGQNFVSGYANVLAY